MTSHWTLPCENTQPNTKTQYWFDCRCSAQYTVLTYPGRSYGLATKHSNIHTYLYIIHLLACYCAGNPLSSLCHLSLCVTTHCFPRQGVESYVKRKDRRPRQAQDNKSRNNLCRRLYLGNPTPHPKKKNPES